MAMPIDAPTKRLTKLSDEPSPALVSGRAFMTTVEGGAMSNHAEHERAEADHGEPGAHDVERRAPTLGHGCA